jgi:hypothetical protein
MAVHFAMKHVLERVFDENTLGHLTSQPTPETTTL